MVIFLETVHWTELKLATVVLHDVMHSLSKFQEKKAQVLQDILKSNSALLPTVPKCWAGVDYLTVFW